MRVRPLIRLEADPPVETAGLPGERLGAASVLLPGAGLAGGRAGGLRHLRLGMLGYLHAGICDLNHCKYEGES